MKITREIISNAVEQNDAEKVLKIFKEIELEKDVRPRFTSGDKTCVTIMLTNASTMSCSGNLDNDLAKEIVNHVAMTVNSFSLLRLIVSAEEIDNDDFSTISKDIRSALKKNEYSPEIAHEIETMSRKTFETLLVFLLSGKVKELDVLFNVPIICRIYDEDIIPIDLLFAYMILSLRDTIDEYIFKEILPNASGITGIIGCIPGKIFFGDDEDEEDEGD